MSMTTEHKGATETEQERDDRHEAERWVRALDFADRYGRDDPLARAAALLFFLGDDD
jgi:hypothetical protein